MSEFVIVAAALTTTIAALLAFAPAISHALVRSRARGLPASLAMRLTEEWTGELEAIPNRATKLAFAIGIRLTRRKSFAGLGGDAMTTSEMTARRSVFSSFGGWKTIIATSTMLLALVGYAASFLITPRYRADTLILVVPQRVPDDYVKSAVNSKLDERVRAISMQTLSRTRLERVINEFDLYRDERRTAPMEDVIERMRHDIETKIEHDDAFRVGYVGTDPTTVMRVTERLASLFIDENARDRQSLAANTHDFIETEIEESRRRLVELGNALTALRAEGKDALPEVAVKKLEYETLGTVFKDLLTKREEARIATNLERRRIGEQFTLLEPAQKPERPFTPDRKWTTLVGAVAGLCLGFAMMLSGLGRRSAGPQQTVRVGDISGPQS